MTHFRVGWAISALAIVLPVVAVIALCVGAVAIGPFQVLGAFFEGVGLDSPWALEAQQRIVVLELRLPRVLLGMLVGASLAVAGAAQQGLFRNPLADPSLLGISSGAALAAVTSIVFGDLWADHLPAVLRPFQLPVAAFLGGLLASWVVYRIGTVNGRTLVGTMLLAGIAVNAVALSFSGMLIFVSDDQQLRELTFWSMGSLSRSMWQTVLPALPLLLLPLVVLPWKSRALNAFALGEREAAHLGFDTTQLKRQVIVLTALAVGGAVALTGVIGFVGLIVPHLVRMVVGPDHRLVIPGSMLLGGVLILAADMLARTVVVPAELPIGIVTSCIGGPFFIWLLTRRRAETAL